MPDAVRGNLDWVPGVAEAKRRGRGYRKMSAAVDSPTWGPGEAARLRERLRLAEQDDD